MDWNLALKVGGPSIIAAYVFTTLITSYLERSELIKGDVLVNIFLVLVIFSFCSLMGWLWVRAGKKGDSPLKVTGNDISGNEVGGGMEVGKTADVLDNRIADNKISGDFNIGGKE